MSEKGSVGSASASAAAGAGASSLEAKKLQLNLKVLQRHDPSITEILDSTSHVVLYRYVPAPAPADVDSQYSAPDMQWTKTNMAGGMFIYKRSQAPHYGFFVLNRHGVDNFCHFLEDEDDLELTPEFIILKSLDEEIKGIWVFEEDHRERLGQKMLELSRLSKHGPAMSRAPASASLLATTDSPGSTGSSKPLPSGQSISLDMLFGSALGGGGNAGAPQQQGGNNNGLASHSQEDDQANSSNIWDGLGQVQSSGLPASPSRENTDHQGVNLLESLFADMGNSATAKPSPTSSERLRNAQQNISTAATADENALRTLLGLAAPEIIPVQQARSQGRPSPSGYSHALPQQAEQQQQQASLLPQLEALLQGPSAQQLALSQSQRPRPPAQLPPQAQAPVPRPEPLAPRPQRMAQFDSVGYEPPVQAVPMSLQYAQSTQQPQGPGYGQGQQLSNVMDHHPMTTRYQQGQPPPPLPPPSNPHVQAQRAQQPQQSFNSAPLMPSVILNKGGRSGSQVSPQVQQRVIPQAQPQQPAGVPIYASQYASQPPAQQQQPQYSPSHPNFQRQMSPPPILRVKSPLRQSTTYYSGSEYSSSEPRYGAVSIPPPPVPVESRPNQSAGAQVSIPQQQQQQQQQQQGRQNSGGDRGPVFSPRASPQRPQEQLNPSPRTLDILSSTLQRTGMYPVAPARAPPGAAPQPIPFDKQAFRQHIYTLVQDERFLEALYECYLDSLEGKA